MVGGDVLQSAVAMIPKDVQRRWVERTALATVSLTSHCDKSARSPRLDETGLAHSSPVSRIELPQERLRNDFPIYEP